VNVIPATTVLTVGPSPNFPRRLWMSWTALSIAAAVYPEDPLARRFALAHAFHANTVLNRSERIELNLRTSVLWIGRTEFDLLPDEAQQIRECFEPLGLQVISEFPSSAVPSLPADTQAAPSYQPPDDARGISPVPELVSAGESENTRA